MDTLTFEGLKTYLKPTIHFGKMEIHIFRQKDGYKIEVLERDEYEIIDEQGKSHGKGGDLTNPFNIFTDEKGEIGRIEHRYGLMTHANKNEQMYILQLIDVSISDLSETNISPVIPLPTAHEQQFNHLMKTIKKDMPSQNNKTPK